MVNSTGKFWDKSHAETRGGGGGFVAGEAGECKCEFLIVINIDTWQQTWLIWIHLGLE